MHRGLPPIFFAAVLLGCSSAAEEAREDPGAGTKAPTVRPQTDNEPPPAPPPFGNAAADEAEAALVLGFERALYDAIEAGEDAAVPSSALELACVRAGLDDDAHARLAQAAATQNVALGPLRLIRLEGPSLATACRPVAASSAILAPLFRVQESPASWRVRSFTGDLGAALVALGAQTPAAPPRLVLVGDKRHALALPLEAQEP